MEVFTDVGIYKCCVSATLVSSLIIWIVFLLNPWGCALPRGGSLLDSMGCYGLRSSFWQAALGFWVPHWQRSVRAFVFSCPFLNLGTLGSPSHCLIKLPTCICATSALSWGLWVQHSSCWGVQTSPHSLLCHIHFQQTPLHPCGSYLKLWYWLPS